MAQAQTIKFGKAMVLLGDGESPEVFAAPCGVEELTMTVETEANSTNAPDCENPDLPGWLESDLVSRQMTIQGQGVLAQQALMTWQDWWYNDQPATEINVRFFRDIGASVGGGYFQGRAILTAYEESGSRGERWRNSFTITFNGKPTWVPNVT